MISLLLVICLLIACVWDVGAEQVPLSLASHHDLLEDGDPVPKLPGKRQHIPDLYKRRYSEITWIGSHNSEALRTEDNGWTLSGKVSRLP